MMALLRPSRPSRFVAAVLALAAIWFVAGLARPASQGQTTGPYVLYSTEGRRTIAVRQSGNREVFTLNLLNGLFGLKFVEDFLAGGLVIETRGERIIAVPGQNFVQVAGKIISLDGPIEWERNAWQVPFDFLVKAVGPAIGQRVVIRRPSRLILVGDVRVPQVTGRVERTATGGRLVLEIQPAAPRRVVREGNRLLIRFDALALDSSPIPGTVPDFITGVRYDGTSVVINLGSSAALYKADDDRDLTRLTVELLPPPPPLPPMPRGGPPLPVGPAGRAFEPPPDPNQPKPPPPPVVDLTPGAIRTVVIDPGHGGADAGTSGASGAKEKDITLEIARRLKVAIESRLGLRVLLTRERDEDVAIDQRTALANNNKADLLVSLHANASLKPGMRGAQVISLSLDDYPAPDLSADLKRSAVPVIGGGTRSVAAVPWDLAQIPFASRSASFGTVLAGRLHERAVPLHPRATDLAPVRLLVGANMPAVMIELGFLTNADDERALTDGSLATAIIEAMLAAIADVRRGIFEPNPTGGGQ
jgi:N-acetylmuramoyl-L-alanine amidase